MLAYYFFFIFDLNNYEMKNTTIDYIIKSTWTTIAKMYNEEASKYGGNMTIGYALLNIDKEHGIQSTALAPRLGMEPTSLTRTLKTMEEKGLIYKKKNPKDGRGVFIHLTEFGLEKREISKQTVLAFNQLVENNIKPEDLKTFLTVSEKIHELVQKRTK